MEGVLLLPTLFKKIQEGKKMISLIIPTYNKLPRLKLTLASINFQTIDRSSFEVTVFTEK